jgi:hypothetical protein
VSKYPISALLSIPIAGYCSIKRLDLENLSLLNIGQFFITIGIIHLDSEK